MYKTDRFKSIAENYLQKKEYKDSLNKLNRIDLIHFSYFLENSYPELRIRVHNDNLIIKAI